MSTAGYSASPSNLKTPGLDNLGILSSRPALHIRGLSTQLQFAYTHDELVSIQLATWRATSSWWIIGKPLQDVMVEGTMKTRWW